MRCPSGHNRGVTWIGGMTSRLVVVALLAVGLVGMHHLVVVACHHVAASSTTPAPLGMDTHDATSHATGHGSPAPVKQDAPHEAPAGLIGAAATCLAIVLMLVLLVAPRLTSRLRRVLVPDRLPAPRRVVTRLLEPPDLHLLSVSRT